MKLLACLGAMTAIVAVAAPASADVVVSNYDLTFDNNNAAVISSSQTAAGEYQDIYTFTIGTAFTLAGSLTTQRIRDVNNAIVSDLDFGNSLPSDGVFLTGGNLSSPILFDIPAGNTDAEETEHLNTTQLAAGTYKLTVNYTVDTASPGHAAVYAGPVLAAPAAVPEASTWAMMLCGFGVVGAGLRSQRRRTLVKFA
jgi:hypothetical protein